MNGIFVFSALLFLAVRGFEWPFESAPYEWGGAQYDRNVLNLTIGTPAQTIQLAVVTSSGPTRADLVLWDHVVAGAAFDWDSSTSLQQTAAVYDEDGGPTGLRAKEVFQIGGKSQLSPEFTILHTDDTAPNFPLLELSAPTDGSTGFVSALLDGQQEQVVVEHFDQINGTFFNGSLVFGDRAPGYCKNDWVVRSQALGMYQWMMEPSEISVGAYTFDLPSALPVFISVHQYAFYLPPPQFAQVVKALGGTVGDDNPEIPCNQAVDITITVQGFDLTLTPADYLGTEYVSCWIRIEQFKGYPIVLPPHVLRNHCLLFDYADNRVGLAKKKKNH